MITNLHDTQMLPLNEVISIRWVWPFVSGSCNYMPPHRPSDKRALLACNMNIEELTSIAGALKRALVLFCLLITINMNTSRLSYEPNAHIRPANMLCFVSSCSLGDSRFMKCVTNRKEETGQRITESAGALPLSSWRHEFGHFSDVSKAFSGTG